MINHKNIVLAVALVLGCVGNANAQQPWPARPIKLVVPLVAGGYPDRVARIVSNQLSKQLKVPFFVENRDGANGTIGTVQARNAAPDGYTFLLASIGPFGIGPALDDKLPYDPVRDFAPVALVTTNPVVLLVSAQSAYRTLGDFVAASKASKQPLMYSSFGQGTSAHLSMERIAIATGIKLTHIPYRGTGPATLALINGDVQALVSNVQDALPHIRSGKLRPLAMAGKERLNALPDTATFSEMGYPQIDASNWLGILAPTGTPETILDRVNAEINTALKDPAVQKQLAPSQELIVLGGTRAALQQHVIAEIARWKGVIQAAGISKE